jgi:hypothetical protein
MTLSGYDESLLRLLVRRNLSGRVYILHKNIAQVSLLCRRSLYEHELWMEVER